jgi:SH3 domain protein
MQKMIIVVVTWIVLLTTSTAYAESLYITDKISIAVYSGKDKSTEPVKQLPSGTIVKVLGKDDKYTNILTNDDVEGWVESKFLTNEKPIQIDYLQLVAKYNAAQDKIHDYETRLLEMQELRKEAKTADWLRNQLNENQRSENVLEQQIKLKDIEVADLKITIANLEEKLIQSRSQLDEVLQSIQSGDSQQLLVGIDEDSGESIYSTSSSTSFYTWLVLSLAVTLIIGILMGFVLIDYKVRKKHGDLKFY